jgi:hypothetical protein
VWNELGRAALPGERFDSFAVIPLGPTKANGGNATGLRQIVQVPRADVQRFGGFFAGQQRLDKIGANGHRSSKKTGLTQKSSSPRQDKQTARIVLGQLSGQTHEVIEE